MKNVFKIGGIALAVVAIVVGVVWAASGGEDEICRVVNIETNGDFLNVNEIQSGLRKQNLYPVGMPMRRISTQAIEDGMLANDMVRSARCYKRGDTIVELYVEQRMPILRVLSDGETYYVDADRKRMPVCSGVRTNVIWVRGHIGEQMAKEEIADFVVWLNDNSYWQPRIRRIEIREGKQAVLRQSEGEPVILLGRVTDYEQKLHKVRVFIEEMSAGGGAVPAYRELDARFDGQIVGRY